MDGSSYQGISPELFQCYDQSNPMPILDLNREFMPAKVGPVAVQQLAVPTMQGNIGNHVIDAKKALHNIPATYPMKMPYQM